MIALLAADGGILSENQFVPDQIQPASLDLRLGEVAYRVRASFLPGRTTVAQRIDGLKLHEISLTDGAVLETGCVYIVPLLESLALPADISAAANPKSSTGRLDVTVSRPAITVRSMPRSVRALFRFWFVKARDCRRFAFAAAMLCSTRILCALCMHVSGSSTPTMPT